MSIYTSEGQVVSPAITNIAPSAFLNVDSQLTNVVTIDGIHDTFTVTLSNANAAILLNAFDVSGFVIDCRLQEHDPDVSALTITFNNSDGLKTVLQSILNDGEDSNANVLDQYLANELRNAFVAAFNNVLPNSDICGNNTATDGNATGLQGATGGSGLSDPAKDVGQNNMTVSITTQSRINGFVVDVLTDISGAAAALVAKHSASANSLRQIFFQIPRSTYELYLPADVSGEFEVLRTNALPMKIGDKLAFAFDVDVSTAGGNADGSLEKIVTDSTANGATSGKYGYGKSEFNLDLAKRRVVFNVTLGDEGSGQFPVGSAAGNLRATDETAVAGSNPGQGTGWSAAGNTGTDAGTPYVPQ